MQALDWTCQKTRNQSQGRNDAQIAAWRDEEWPRIKRGAERGDKLAFVDESGFLPQAQHKKNLGPRGTLLFSNIGSTGNV